MTEAPSLPTYVNCARCNHFHLETPEPREDGVVYAADYTYYRDNYMTQDNYVVLCKAHEYDEMSSVTHPEQRKFA